MPSIIITLKEVAPYKWRLFAPKGHTVSSEFRGKKYNALEWAKAYCSTWPDWVVRCEEHNESEKLS